MTDETDEECLARLLAVTVQEGKYLVVKLGRPLHMQERRVFTEWVQGPLRRCELNEGLIA